MAGGFISRISNLVAGAAQPWTPDPPYPSIFDLNVHRRELDRKGGIYLLWHLGVRPCWLRVGQSADLGGSLGVLATLDLVRSRRPNGGVFVAWSVVPHDQRAGIVQFLAERLRPELPALVVAGEPAARDTTPIPFVLPPGTLDPATDVS